MDMYRRLFTKPGLAAAVLGGALFLSAAPAAATFESGLQAFQKGDYATALKDWEVLAARSHARSQYQLGVMYNEGHGVPKDPDKAISWWTKAAQLGYVEAQHIVAHSYLYGSRGFKQDDGRAFRWFEKAAKQGFSKSQYTLGKMYE